MKALWQIRGKLRGKFSDDILACLALICNTRMRPGKQGFQSLSNGLAITNDMDPCLFNTRHPEFRFAL